MHTLDRRLPDNALRTNPMTVRRSAIRTIPITATATAAIAAAATAGLDLDRTFAGLDPRTVAITSTVSLTAGALALSGLRRISTKGTQYFKRLALAVAALSLMGPATVRWAEPPDGAAHSRPLTALVLACLHVLTYAAALRMAGQAGTNPD